jgi:DNA-binding XRE family transcriptional regulator
MPNVKSINPMKREWLKKARKEKKLTLEAIAPHFNISWQHYYDIECGRRNPSLELSFTIAEFLEVEPKMFLENRATFETEGFPRT